MKKMLSCVLVVLLLFVMAGCGTTDNDQTAAGPQIASDLQITGDGVDLTVTADEMNAISTETFTCTNVDSEGEVATVEVVGFDLLSYLEGQDVDLTSVTSMNLVASDGYQMAVPKETYAESGVYIALAIDDEYFDAPRSCLPDQRAMYWVKYLTTIELVSDDTGDATETDITKVQMFRELTEGMESATLDNRGYDVQAYSLNTFFSDYMDAVPTAPVTITAQDGFEKTETADVFLSCYVTYEAEEGSEGDLPLYFSEDLSDGMRVKQLDTVVSGSEAVYFGSEISVPDLFEAIGMSEADSYQFIASDGYVTTIPADAIEYGLIYTDEEDDYIRAGFDGYDWGDTPGGGKVKYLTTIVAGETSEGPDGGADGSGSSDETMLKLFVGDTKYTMTESDFLALPQMTVTLSKTNKAGETTTGEYEGVHWTDIADLLEIDPDVAVTLVASDDYEVQLESDVLNDPDSVFALYQDGETIESENGGRVWFCASENYTANNWVKYVVKIVVD